MMSEAQVNKINAIIKHSYICLFIYLLAVLTYLWGASEEMLLIACHYVVDLLACKGDEIPLGLEEN